MGTPIKKKPKKPVDRRLSDEIVTSLNEAAIESESPIREAWSDLLRQVGEEIEPKSGEAYKLVVARALWKEAAKGNIRAIRLLMLKMEGLPKKSSGMTPPYSSPPIYGGSSQTRA